MGGKVKGHMMNVSSFGWKRAVLLVIVGGVYVGSQKILKSFCERGWRG